jgi:hypothetical protein
MGSGWLVMAFLLPPGTDIPLLVDRGIELQYGRDLHRLTPADGTFADPLLFGRGTTPALSGDVQADVSFWVADDGSLVGITVSTNGTVDAPGAADDGAPVSMMADLKFGPREDTRGITRPSDYWGAFTSQRFHYSLSYPPHWTNDGSNPQADRFTGPNGIMVALRSSTAGFTLNDLAKAEIAANNKSSGLVLDKNTSYTLAGLPARLLTYHGTYSGLPAVAYEVMTVDAGNWYDLLWIGSKPNASAGLADFKKILATFVPMP